MDKLRFNPIGIQMIPEFLHRKLFGGGKRQIPNVTAEKLNYVIENLQKSFDKVQFKADSRESINHHYPWHSVKYMPPLTNNNVVDHFDALGRKYSSPYLRHIRDLMTIPAHLFDNRPKQWSFTKGWTRYSLGSTGDYCIEPVTRPLENAMVFDIEVSLEERNKNRPSLAVAITPQAWYSWCGETVINLHNHSSDAFNFDELNLNDLIPMGYSREKERIIVGHNVSFDRSYIKEQYDINLDKTRFLDTMSLHISVSGLNQDQRLFALKNGNPWNEISSFNNLKDVHRLYCNESQLEVDKDPRDIFVKGTLQEVHDNFQLLTDYCANDVAVTLQILKSLFPTFSQRFPSPITLVGMLEMSVMYLPVNKRTWSRYLNESQSIYQEYKDEINQTLKEIACESCSYLEQQNYTKDPWLWDLDWTCRDVAFKKAFEQKSTEKKELENATVVDELLATSKHLKKNQPVIPGYPKWFLEFCESSKNLSKLHEIDWNVLLESNQLSISPKLRAIPKLLKLMWNGCPLYYDKTHGWGYLLPDPMLHDSDLSFGPLPALIELVRSNGVTVDMFPPETAIRDVVPGCLFYRLPHKDGPGKRVGNPLGKDFISKIVDGTLRSYLNEVKELVLQQNKISYWVNSSKRILSQMVLAYDQDQGDGCILPKVVVAGTVTRRAVEPTWLTASNSYSDRLGSELKGIIQCPVGYCYVGADVDSQELWIAALLGDAHYSGIQGSTGLGWMTLRGEKSLGTDMHSVTAKSINVSRDEAKVLNYARIYGSGPDFAARFLKQSNPELNEEEAKRKAKKIFVETKGYRKKNTKLINQQWCVMREWQGGTESHMFNKLEEIATSEQPETPFLKCRISRALEPSAVGYDFMTSRINWVVQSSAVDFLHILLLAMKWLIHEYGIEGRFSISIHDEIRYIVKEEHKYRAALALQLSNLMTRSFFTASLQLNDLPASVAFFSSIEIDKCLRKNVTHDCKTPSNPLGLSKGYGVPQGVELSIHKLLEALQQHDTEFSKWCCAPRCDDDLHKSPHNNNEGSPPTPTPPPSEFRATPV